MIFWETRLRPASLRTFVFMSSQAKPNLKDSRHFLVVGDFHYWLDVNNRSPINRLNRPDLQMRPLDFQNLAAMQPHGIRAVR